MMLLTTGEREMPIDTWLQRHKERLCNRTQRLRGGLARLWTKGIEWTSGRIRAKTYGYE